TSYSKAATSELLGDFDQAFRHYVKAAEIFLHLSQISRDARQRTNYKDQAAKALERAEKIRIARPELRPLARNHFSDHEQSYVLRKSSIVNGTRFPLWDEGPGIHCDTRSVVTLPHPALSPNQLRNSATWRSLGNVFSEDSPLEPQDIIQHIITDCSVCGAIAICICHNRRFQSELGSSSLHLANDDQSAEEPSSHIYHVRLLFNGAYRRVAIDDKLPTYPDGRLMCLSTGNQKQIWPSLLEKAYMKLMGGYDFPGSSVALRVLRPHALAGWIPEHVNLKSAKSQRERLWGRVALGFYNGSCMLTLGTGGKMENVEENSIQLLPAHCYAVTDISSSPNKREITLLDSWTHSSATLPSELTSYARDATPHSFILSWDAVCNIFDGAYLSWDPGIFKYETTHHGTWMAGSISLQNEGIRSSHLQLQLRTAVDQSQQGAQEIWVHLTRHVSDTKRTSEYISLLVDGDEEPSGSSPDVNPNTLKCEYTNNIHTLVRYAAMRADQVLRIVSAYEGQLEEVGFTIAVYSNSRVSWIEEISQSLYSKDVDGAFSLKNAGGHHGYPTFMDNPQYHLRIYPTQSSQSQHSVTNNKAATTITFRSSRHLPINVSVAWSKGERVTELGDNELAATSGPYGFGYAHVTRELSAGDYTLILSAFEPQQQGPFKLRIESQLRFDLTPIPQEGAGMFSKVVRGAWTAETAGGGPSSSRYATNPLYEIQVDTATQLMIRLQLVDAVSPASTNVSVFQQKAPRKLITTSGPYSDAVAGVATPRIMLQPGVYHVVPSTYNPGLLRAYKLIFYTGCLVKISAVTRGETRRTTVTP
ncbi:hypothetical protein C8Q72DRAFT_786967, partial [Fomitopsis betulina]